MMVIVSAFRFTAAAIFTSAISSLIFGGLSGSLQALPLAFGFSLPYALLVGMPIAVLLDRSGRLDWRNAVATGFSLGIALPLLFLLLFLPLAGGSGGSSAVGGVPMVVDGVRTAAGWASLAQFVFSAGLLGAAGSLGGYAVWKISARRPLLIGCAAMSLAPAILAIPEITKDRSCHNVLRDGRRSIAPVHHVKFSIESGEWKRVVERLSTFGSRWNLDVRAEYGDSRRVQPLSLCSEAGFTMRASGGAWMEMPDMPFPTAERGVSIVVYETKGGSPWRSAVTDLESDLARDWSLWNIPTAR